MSFCPCDSHLEYKTCCQPYLSGKAAPDTAEALMRSRYTAYVKQDIDYLSKTHHPQTRHEFDPEAAKEWSEKSSWKGLEIKSVQQGASKDDEGFVEFIAHYEMDDQPTDHYEIGQFKKLDGQWYFFDGKTPRDPYIRSAPKVGRNDPCPCGSGKKSKKCCAA